MTATTTILGTTYNGRPLFGSLALQLWIYEQRGEADKARALLDATNHIRRCFGQEPIDLAQQFTVNPSSMAALLPSALAKVEVDAGFEPRAIDRVVERTARAAA